MQPRDRLATPLWVAAHSASRRALAVGLVALAGAFGCSSLVGDYAVGESTSSGGVGASGGAGGDITGGEAGSGGDVVGGMCDLALPSPPPDAPGESPEVSGFTVAFDSINFGDDATRGATVGFDLDGRCTCDVHGPSCVSEARTTCDGALGVDNSWGKVLEAGGQSLGITSSSATQAILDGNWTILLSVADYNERLEDEQVTVSWYLGRDYQSSMAQPIPVFDGDDAWRASTASFNNPSKPDINDVKFRDSDAYVTGGRLVARFPDLALQVGGNTNSMRFDLKQAVLVGTLQKVAADPRLGWTLVDGNVGAILSEANIFKALSSYLNENGAPSCTDETLFYGLARQLACNARDITYPQAASDSSCDAMSFGFAFSTFPARLATGFQSPPTSGGCPAELDPANDACAP